MKWVNSTDLEYWASSRDCQEFLPLVIRRLIRGTVNNINSISFPSGKNVVYPGWDGRLESSEKTEYIPEGLSLWEISTTEKIKEKAEYDYQKRKQNPLGYDPSDATFIFVTPRIWLKKEQWVNEKKKEKFWKDVKVYDAKDLEEWLEQVPAVGVWLAKHIGKFPGDTQSLEDWWNEWSKTTNPPIIPELVISGRKEESEKIRKWLEESSPLPLSVQSLTKDEAIAFLYAVISQLPENEKEYYLSKSLVLFNENSFRHITTTSKNRLLLILTFEEIDIAKPYSNIHQIFIPLNPDNTVSKEKIILSYPKRLEFVDSLVKMGVSREDAEKYSRETARSLSVLRRQLSPISRQPEWAKPDKASELLPILLAGEFNENREGDREIIAEIAKQPYEKCIASLKKWLYQPDPPILQIGDVWRLTSPLDAFFALSPFLTKSDFENFENVALKVLREIDPALELEPEKRWMASAYGKIPKYSKELRRGISQSLVLIAVFGDEVNNGNGLDLPYSPQRWIDNLIRKLLSKADGKLWYSLSDVLPLLAESSPLSFLNAVEDSLSQEKPPIMEMFSETKNLLTSHSAHPSLLWALEGLAWDPNLLSEVILILGKLARLDPGGELSNRPINTLKSIFLLWHPQTFANLKQRLNSLDLLIERESKVAWNLLINLLPYPHDIGYSNYRPRWRQSSEKTEKKITIEEYLNGITGIVDRVLKNIGFDANKWCEVMEHFPYLPSQEKNKVLSKLSECANLIKEGKVDIWNKLRQILYHHRTFRDATWALPEEELKEIEKLYNQLEPDEIIKRFQWLFDDYYPPFPEGRELQDHEKLEQSINQKRKEAVESILNSLGIEGIITLATQTEYPHFVGISLAEISLTDKEEETLFSLLDSDVQKKISFTQSYIFQKSSKEGDIYVNKIVDYALNENWPSRKVVNLFLALPQKRKIWDLLGKFSVQIQQEYWKKLSPRFFDLPTEDKLYGLNKLIEEKRYFTALNTVAMFEEIPARFIYEILKNAALEESADNPNIVSSWGIQKLFTVLDQSKDINKNELAYLEWLYLPVLADVGSNRPPKVLHQELANNPEFFCEVIKYIYKPKNEYIDEKDEGLPSKLKEQRAQLAWKLLYSWKTVPGSDATGKVDYQKLKEWVNKARSICERNYRLEVCDYHIGQVFAYAVPDANGDWPPEAICKIIEEVRSEELDKGFAIGIYNKRGVITKSPFEGGKQEMELAKQYKLYSTKWATKYPRVSAILEKVAKDYENEARHEDKEAKKLDLNW